MDNSFIGFAGMAETMLGGLTSAFGNFAAGQAQEQMYNYQAGVARLDAQIARQNAQYATQVGELSAQRYGMMAGQRMGQITAAQSSSGLDIKSGSAVDVRASQKLVSAMDVAAVRSDAARTAYNYQVQGVQFDAQAQLDTLAGKNAATAGMVGAFGSIVGAASSITSGWLRPASPAWGGTQ
jgi:hypothetical protein